MAVSDFFAFAVSTNVKWRKCLVTHLFVWLTCTRVFDGALFRFVCRGCGLETLVDIEFHLMQGR